MAEKLGRPSEYTQETAEKICEMLSRGVSLRTVCLQKDMPSGATVFKWMRENPDFLKQYASAKEESTNAHLETLEELGDQAIQLAQSVDSKASGAVVQAVKLKADNLKWVMSKMKPKKYGEHLDVTSEGKALPTPIYNAKSTSDGTS